MTNIEVMTHEIVAAATELSRAGRWERALALLDATGGDGDPRIAVAAAEVALERSWFAGPGDVADRIAAAKKAGGDGWDLDFVRLRHDYSELLQAADGTFAFGPWGKDPEAIADLERRGQELFAKAPDERRAGWAQMYRGLITDNLRADRAAAPAFYEAALAAAGPLPTSATKAASVGGDAALAREALRHLGDHDHDNGDHEAALDRWQQAAALAAVAGLVPGTLSQQIQLAVLARDAGDEAGAVALAAEVRRWADAVGAARLAEQSAGFLAGVDPTRPPAQAAAARS
jgi:hypothetical protein